MTDIFPFVNAIIQWVVVPLIGVVWALYQKSHAHASDIAVLKAEATAREQSRLSDRESVKQQLDAILTSLNQMNARIDTFLQSGRPRS